MLQLLLLITYLVIFLLHVSIIFAVVDVDISVDIIFVVAYFPTELLLLLLLVTLSSSLLFIIVARSIMVLYF